MKNGNEIRFERVRTGERLREFRETVAVGFLGGTIAPEVWADAFRPRIDMDAFDVAVDGRDIVGTFWAFDQTMTAVGGADVPTRGVSSVVVLPTHRRRGILTRFMRDCLRDAAEAGCAAATLVAAEYGIYGRFGFGPASRAAGFTVDVGAADLGDVGGADLRFASGAEYLAASELVHDAVRIPGKVSRPPRRGERLAGLALRDGPDTRRRVVLHRGDGPAGVVAYRAEEKWEGNLPRAEATVEELLGVDADAERTLWRFVASVDWVTTVHTGPRPVDDPLQDWASNPRGVVMRDLSDHVWLRPLDLPALFAARTYASAGRVVLDVTDPGWGDGPGPAHGRFAFESDGRTGRCVPSDEPAADLALDVTVLPRLWLSDDTLGRRVTVGDVRELTPGAAARADAMLQQSRRPWAVEGF
ncbi:GNAT family N-acetyltransferase [Tsukamurella sp. 8F]|uniref:GNAT family N-acetyltransferase n=1 Tax=unclassified Tsukamurella TaxID=2633480 RepID=UPI0023B97050|nr:MULTISPECIES: GNAT family N-acetyltransferase [unclassified Tsukamurella]MDF0530030.1 GNAT family N-acetyltransferase [Tsukamurella sp. 8J]MDF0587198.1 GNAT family N-acetyltransferase [Tsukamurella sp. 8F]